MKPITKRDIAEIALVMLIVGFMLRAFGGLVLMLSWMAPWRQGFFESAALAFFLDALSFGIVLVCMIGLLWKRYAILGRLFPESDSEEGGVSVPEVLAAYVFWIRLFGIWIILSLGMQLVRYLIPAPFSVFEYTKLQMILRGIPSAIATVVLGLVVIWQAPTIARFVEWLGHRGEGQSEGGTSSGADGAA